MTPEGENGLRGTVANLPDRRIVMGGFLTTSSSHAFIGEEGDRRAILAVDA